MKNTATVESAAVENARREMVQLRESQAERLTKREAVRRLAKEIRAAKSTCTDEAIVEVLKKHGIALSVATLRGYLRGGGGEAKAGKKGRRAHVAAPPTPPAAPSAVGPKVPTHGSGGSSERDEARSADVAVPGVRSTETAPTTGGGAKPAGRVG
jgi:hypothetical protein